MSKYQDCILFVDGNGRYCCRPKTFRIGEDQSCGYTISLANVESVDLQIQVADEWVPFETLTDPANNIIAAGCFRIDPAFCEELNGTEAPEENPMSVCCVEIDCEALDYLAICEKLEALGEMGGPGSSSEAMLEKLCEIAELLEEPVPTGIEASSVRVGCALDAAGEAIGTVFLCKTVDEETEELTIVPMAFMYAGGEVVNPYTGEWGLCDPACPPSPPLGLITDLSLLES